ncbi:hypothetical protein ACFLY6_02765 [Candidatus Dependentiae bacterium]
MRKYIRFAQVLSHIILFGYICGAIFVWFHGSMGQNLSFIANYRFSGDFLGVLAELSFERRMCGIFLDFPGLVILTFGWWRFQQIVGCFLRGEAFSFRVASYFVSLGRTALIWTVWGFIERALFSVFMSWHKGLGNRVLEISVSSRDIPGIIIAVVLFILAHGIKHAAEVEKERKLTI